MENKNMFNTVEEYELYLDELYNAITAKMEKAQREKNGTNFMAGEGKINQIYVKWQTAENAFLETMTLFTSIERKMKRDEKRNEIMKR